ncbi:Outer membrane lipoprotein-sorting protein [hydrothermal vent metagenome]|uniref:Outer membrane lipoprotein-sorting protein n=1 Tax=hydrothermal vent metagenome TaxID=652676 RepID=A0A3B1D108_9ZZZZ
MKLITFFILLAFNLLFAQNAYEIVKKSNDNIMGLTSQSISKMTIIRPDWSREVEMKTWSKGTKYFLIYITSPPRDEGQVFLKRDKELWNWMPSIGRMIKLPPSMMMQSWMGSDFTNDDLLKQSSVVKDYTHKIIGEDKIEGYDCWIIELIPKPDAPVVWGKIIMHISKKHYLQLKVKFFDETLELVNTMIGSKIKDVGDRTLPTRLEMKPADKPGNKTIFEYSEIKFNIPISNSFFSKQNMKRIK